VNIDAEQVDICNLHFSSFHYATGR